VEARNEEINSFYDSDRNRFLAFGKHCGPRPGDTGRLSRGVEDAGPEGRFQGRCVEGEKRATIRELRGRMGHCQHGQDCDNEDDSIALAAKQVRG